MLASSRFYKSHRDISSCFVKQPLDNEDSASNEQFCTVPVNTHARGHLLANKAQLSKIIQCKLSPVKAHKRTQTRFNTSSNQYNNKDRSQDGSENAIIESQDEVFCKTLL